jgi:hypothetical protein
MVNFWGWLTSPTVTLLTYHLVELIALFTNDMLLIAEGTPTRCNAIMLLSWETAMPESVADADMWPNQLRYEIRRQRTNHSQKAGSLRCNSRVHQVGMC